LYKEGHLARQEKRNHLRRRPSKNQKKTSYRWGEGKKPHSGGSKENPSENQEKIPHAQKKGANF